MNHSTVASLLACLFAFAAAPAPAAPAPRPPAAADRPESPDAPRPDANEPPAEIEGADPQPAPDAPEPAADDQDPGAAPAAKPAAPAKPKAGGNELPTADEIQQSFDAGAYEQTLKLLSRVLPLKGKAAEPYDRSALLELKVETHLRLKAAAPAMQALEQAAEATNDPKEQARYRATAALIKRSKGLSYVPKQKKKGKGPGSGSIDLVDPKQRLVALDAMWADELARVKPKAGSAARQKVLPPIAAAIKEVKAVVDLELGATGSQDETNGMLSDLNGQGLKLIGKTVDRMAKRVDSIDAAADEVIRQRVSPVRGGRGVTPTRRTGVDRRGRFAGEEIERRRGVRPEEIQELKEIIKTCPQLAKAAGELVEMSGQDTDAAESIIDKATETAEKAEGVLADG